MKIRIYTMMAGLFLLGVLCGILLSFGFAKNQIRSLTSRPTAEVSELIAQVLDHRLDLNAEQKAATLRVLRESEKQALPLRREFREGVLGIIQTYQPEIAANLDQTQQKQLDQLIENLLGTWQLAEDPDANRKPQP